MEEEISDLLPFVLEDIVRGKCVLFLGPELLINKNGKYYKSFFKELENDNKSCYKYFSRDNLFSISGEGKDLKKRILINKIAGFYKDAGDEIILSLISQIPFSLIINVAPDLAVNEFFIKNKFKFRAIPAIPDVSNVNSPASESIPPTINDPIIYNIFGNYQDINSLIVTHRDLFKAIKALMQKDKIPISIQTYINEANSFIFLGLKFETWYYQLLLTILDVDESHHLVRNRIGAPNELDNDTVSVMNSHFQISFAKNNPLKVIQHIYDALIKQGISLRRPTIEAPQSVAYISYAWNDSDNTSREDFVDLICNKLSQNAGIKIFRDRNILTIQDSIESFMNRMGRGKGIILVISDKYLKSEYCMYEAWQVYKNDNFKERVFIAILSDVDRSDEGILNYIRYWQDKKDTIGNILSKEFRDDPIAFANLIVRYKNVCYILLFIDDFLKLLKDTISLQVPKTFDETAEANFNNFINLIGTKLKNSCERAIE